MSVWIGLVWFGLICVFVCWCCVVCVCVVWLLLCAFVCVFGSSLCSSGGCLRWCVVRGWLVLFACLSVCVCMFGCLVVWALRARVIV